MIVIKLQGGLGNQMFQYAAGLALAAERNTVLKLDVSWFRERTDFESHNRYGLSCFNITEQFATEEEVERAAGFALTRTERWTNAFASRLRLYRHVRRNAPTGRTYIQPKHVFDPAFFSLPNPTYLDGMFQSEKFFQRSTSLVQEHFSFRYPYGREAGQLAAHIRHAPSAAVHIRRGDYLSDPHYRRTIGPLAFDYYERAIRHLSEKHPGITLFVFSDDIRVVAREFKPSIPHVFVSASETRLPHEELRLMSQCDHFITANSTFSWWAAWLGRCPAKTVIAPEPWFSDSSIAAPHLIPRDWTQVSRSE